MSFSWITDMPPDEWRFNFISKREPAPKDIPIVATLDHRGPSVRLLLNGRPVLLINRSGHLRRTRIEGNTPLHIPTQIARVGGNAMRVITMDEPIDIGT